MPFGMQVPGEFVVAWIAMAAFAGWALDWRLTGPPPRPRNQLRRAAGWVVLTVLFYWAGTWVWAILGLGCPEDVPIEACFQ